MKQKSIFLAINNFTPFRTRSVKQKGYKMIAGTFCLDEMALVPG
jgi:hypothetical protein